MELKNCLTCSRSKEQLERRSHTWECSHVDCPQRAATAVPPQRDPSYAPKFEGSYRREPTSDRGERA